MSVGPLLPDLGLLFLFSMIPPGKRVRYQKPGPIIYIKHIGMKKLQNIGKVLSKSEQRQIIGGYDDDPPDGGGDAQCFWTMNPTLPGCADDQGIPVNYTCEDPGAAALAQSTADSLCARDNCCIDVDCIYC